MNPVIIGGCKLCEQNKKIQNLKHPNTMFIPILQMIGRMTWSFKKYQIKKFLELYSNDDLLRNLYNSIWRMPSKQWNPKSDQNFD